MNALVPYLPGSKLYVPFWRAADSAAGTTENPVVIYAKKILGRGLHVVEIAHSDQKENTIFMAYKKKKDGVGTFAQTFFLTTWYVLKGNDKTGDIFLSSHSFDLFYEKAKEGQKDDIITLSERRFNVFSRRYAKRDYIFPDAIESMPKSNGHLLPLLKKMRSIQKILERDWFQLLNEENIRKQDGCNKSEEIIKISSIRVDLFKIHSMLRDMTSQQSNATSSSSEEFHTTISPWIPV
ncbi:MAG: hypothetical protein WB791_08175 [Waddliaceae bacterium]